MHPDQSTIFGELGIEPIRAERPPAAPPKTYRTADGLKLMRALDVRAGDLLDDLA